MPEDLFAHALACLQAQDVETKLTKVAALQHAWLQGSITHLCKSTPVVEVPIPGRPEKPEMVSALLVEKRKVSTPEGRAALLHSLAHIEFNAINLALDAVYRFRELPQEYYTDWLLVASEEAYHFSMLQAHLRTLGYEYGDFTAHNGLWDMAMVTAHDPMIRMALVPRVLEARGLDALPAIMHRLTSCGAQTSADILSIILRDEIGHVAIGNRWYAYFCELRGLDPVANFRALMREYKAPKLRGPLHTEARLAAGFSLAEMDMLEGLIE